MENFDSIVCECCGCVISENDKLCPHCGQNNGSYKEIIEHSSNKAPQSSYVYEPIKKVPINKPTNVVNNTSCISTNTNTQTPVKQYKIRIDEEPAKVPTSDWLIVKFPIASGEYKAKFKKNCQTEMAWYKKYFKLKHTYAIMGGLTLLFFFAGIITLIISFCNQWLFDILGFWYYIIMGIGFIVNLCIMSHAYSSKKVLMYDYILYDLQRKGAKITYENFTTGTISYRMGAVRNQISVYRGYNSHANSRYQH